MWAGARPDRLVRVVASWRAPLPFLVVFYFGVSLARPAAAVTPAITVERDAGAEECPDTADLIARVATILGRALDHEATAYRVTFSHPARGFSAAIRSSSGGDSARWLSAQEPDCAALAHATALALVVLLDVDAPVEKPDATAPEPPRPNPTPSISPPPAAAPVAETPPKIRISPSFSVGVAALVGVLRPVVPALIGDVGLERRDVRASLGAVWVPTQTFELSPGGAREHLVAGTLRVCFAPWDKKLRVDVCTGALVGVATAEARGFTTNERHTESFVAFPAELALSTRTGVVDWELSASALLPVPPNEFTIEGRGSTYHAPPIAGAFALRVRLEPWH
ncbi:MAG TPA: hypothetical protein VH142_06380 [Polyangiaceae bacterium]|jgi:hypothetical protein|nr:hypothetical protein [Polyangiaceae bacterium]